MSKGIREFTNAAFATHLPMIAEVGQTAFRKTVIESVMLQFGVSVASASTHYNFSKKMAMIEAPESVKELGRAPGKNNGGRKPLTTVDVVKVKDGTMVASGLSRGAAELLIAKAAATGNKPKLMVREVPKFVIEIATSMAEVLPAGTRQAIMRGHGIRNFYRPANPSIIPRLIFPSTPMDTAVITIARRSPMNIAGVI